MFCELGDQAADAKSHTGVNYSVREIGVLRSSVWTAGTPENGIWLLNSLV